MQIIQQISIIKTLTKVKNFDDVICMIFLDGEKRNRQCTVQFRLPFLLIRIRLKIRTDK